MRAALQEPSGAPFWDVETAYTDWLCAIYLSRSPRVVVASCIPRRPADEHAIPRIPFCRAPQGSLKGARGRAMKGQSALDPATLQNVLPVLPN
ncbi:hypothetical protein VTO73DRAFT_1777 [Trametes versicolor]